VTSLAYIWGREDKLKVWALDKLGTNFVQTPTPRVWVTRVRIFLKRQSWWAKFRLFSFKQPFVDLLPDERPRVTQLMFGREVDKSEHRTAIAHATDFLHQQGQIVQR
jgi:hypothetical protein